MGHGTYRWLDRSTYEGEVSNGLRHGTGTYKSVKTGTVYRGQWHKGQRHGKVGKIMPNDFNFLSRCTFLNLICYLIDTGDNVLQ